MLLVALNDRINASRLNPFSFKAVARNPRRDSIQMIPRIWRAIPQQVIPDRAHMLTRDEAFGFAPPRDHEARARLPRQPGSHH